jgi:hypothetical protein
MNLQLQPNQKYWPMPQKFLHLRRPWKTQAIRGTMALWSQARSGVMGGKQLGF